MSATQNTRIIPEGVVIMCAEPAADLTIEQAWAAAKKTENDDELAEIYAIAENKAWWLEDEEYDYEPDTPEYLAICNTVDAWFELADYLRNAIFESIRKEKAARGIVWVPTTPWHPILKPFMEEHGYKDGCGWWIKG